MPASPASPSAPRRRGGRPGRADTERLGAAILAAAEQIFLAEGFGGARMEAIAAAAGTTKQTVYARFGSKEALFIEVSNALLRERFAPVSAGRGSLREALVQVADQMLAAMLDPRLVRMHCIITAEAERFPDLARMTDRDESFPGRTMLHALLAEAAARGEIECPDPHRAMLMLQHMVLSVPLRDASLGFNTFDAAARNDWTRYAVDLFLNGALPRPRN